MQRIIARFAPVLFAGLVLVGTSTAQPPAVKQRFGKTPLGVDAVVERIMAFDKGNKGKVAKADLPERMHFLIELGDTNKDGALDRNEVRTLATKLAAGPGEFAAGGPVRVGPGPGGIGGGVRGGVRVGFGPGAPGGFGGGGFARGGFGVGGAIGFGPDAMVGVVDDLKLPAKKRDEAMAAVKAHQEAVRKLVEQARADLLAKMKSILSAEEFNDFRAALDRPRGQTFFNLGPRGAVQIRDQKKLDPLPK